MGNSVNLRSSQRAPRCWVMKRQAPPGSCTSISRGLKERGLLRSQIMFARLALSASFCTAPNYGALEMHRTSDADILDHASEYPIARFRGEFGYDEISGTRKSTIGSVPCRLSVGRGYPRNPARPITTTFPPSAEPSPAISPPRAASIPGSA